MAAGDLLWTGFGSGRRLPLVLQTEASECGLACLAMLAAHHGLGIDLAQMRRRFSISRKGTTLAGLIQTAGSLKLESRPLKCEMEQLPQLQLPCILHWNMNHFVVLKSVSARKAVIHDPAVGKRSFSLAEFGKHFTGIALELSPARNFTAEKPAPRVSLLQMMGGISGLKRSLAEILLLTCVLELVAIAMPFYLQWVVDQVVVSADRDLLTVLGVSFILLALLQSAVSALRSWFVVRLSTHLNFQWLGNVFSHLLKLPLDFFEKRHVGHIVSCFGSVSTIQKTLTTGFVQAVVDGLLVLGTLAMMLLYSRMLALIALLAVGLYAAMRWSVFHALREATAEEIIHAARQQTHFLESASGVQSVRLFGRAEERRIGWMNMLADQFNAELHISRIHIGYETARTLLFGVERLAIIWLAALAVMNRQFSLGMLFTFLAYKDQFSTRVSALIDKLFELGMLRLHGERVADIVLTEAEPAGNTDEVELQELGAGIELRALSYRYAASEALVLDDVNLSFAEGECVAVTGTSGCGKTTLVKVMLGLLAPTTGEVLVGGAPVRQIGLQNYRRMIGTVMQDDRLFTGSIADNISFFDPQPEPDQIERCARLAAVHDDILDMPMGYHTQVGDIGTGLSGGQKQRLLLARALYRKPRILVLDEATSHLDLLNEKSVNEAVKAMKLTRIIVAHRPETIAMADRVVVIERGRVVRDFANCDARVGKRPV